MAIWSQGLILNSGRSYANLPPIYLFLELIQGAFWVQNGKNDGLTIYVSRIVKIAHSVSNHKYSRRFWLFLQIQNPIF